MCAQILYMDHDIHITKTPLLRDNTSAIAITHNFVFRLTTKHIKMRHHFVWYNVEKGKVDINKQFKRDILTKNILVRQGLILNVGE